jgi:transposase InsO family protein
MKSEYFLGKIRHSRGVMKLISHLRMFDRSAVAKERQKIISLYEAYGEKMTKEAFGVDRKLIHLWKKRVKERKGLQGLSPGSQAPKNPRRSKIDIRIVEYIRTQREFVPKMSKKKLKPLLDEFCRKESLSAISTATIGRVIKRNHFFFYKAGRVYHNPESKWAKDSLKTRKKARIRHTPKPAGIGYIQMDTVEKIIDGRKWYLYQAIDVKGKSALSLTYKTLNSQNSVDFFKKLVYVLPYKIKVVQTDNGKEFLKDFRAYLERQGVKHLFIYPHSPRINGVVERFNRTLNEDFFEPNLHLIHDQKAYNQKLAEYMIYYNCQRQHESLNNMTPIDYLIQKGGMSNMLWTCTKT